MTNSFISFNEDRLYNIYDMNYMIYIITVVIRKKLGYGNLKGCGQYNLYRLAYIII